MPFFQSRWPAALFWPLAKIYAAVMEGRNRAFDEGRRSIARLDVPVISIGNITVGGTGKTPTVIFWAQWLQKRHKKVCVLSRGYGRRSRGRVLISDGERILADAAAGGDEPLMIALKTPGVIVVVDADRYRGGTWACRQFHPDVVLLDDGFQHRQLHRDLDVVTFKGDHALGNGWLLPAGPLREPLHNLHRAGLFWLNQAEEDVVSREFHKPVIKAQICPQRVLNHKGEEPDFNATLRALAFCGLAHPQDLGLSLGEKGIEVVRLIPFKDHHIYRHRDIQELELAREKFRADVVITTEKDWVKIVPMHDIPSHWYRLQIAIQPEDAHSADIMIGNLSKGFL